VVLVFLGPADENAAVRFSHDWDASTTHRRGHLFGSRILAASSSPLLRMCGSQRCAISALRPSACSEAMRLILPA
jgi:hypothetical protein